MAAKTDTLRMTRPLSASGQHTPEAEAYFARLRAERERWQAERPALLRDGEAALRRLFAVAQGGSGQCRYVAAFLLGCYNGERFPFDLTDFRCLDRALFDDCLTVLRMDFQPEREVHTYFENGGAAFEELARDWHITDYCQLRRKANGEG